jgi:NADPH:quinone reductase-like Zn-dependent oxidoreductase
LSDVGLAAVQIAKMIGAEIYATVSGDDETRFTRADLDIPQDQIFSCKDTSFVAGIMQKTAGRGVDVAFNSLSGDILHATWKCVAEFGRMIDVGKRDMLGSGKLDLASFLNGRSYAGFHLDTLIANRPDIAAR